MVPGTTRSIVRELNFGGSSVVRGTRTTYDTSSQYRDRHIYNLPKLVESFAGDPLLASVESRTEFDYDTAHPLVETSGAASRDARFQKTSPDYDPRTELRGPARDLCA